MLLDKETLLSEDQAVTATANSTNVVDLGAVNALVPQINLRGRRARLVVRVTADFATLTSLVVTITTDSVAAMSSEAIIKTSPSIAAAALLAGKVIFDEPITDDLLEQFIRATYTVTGSDATAGTITAGIVWDEVANLGSI